MSEGVIEGQVAAVFGSREVLINRGAKHGVQIGMRFAILDEPTKVPLDETGTAVEIRFPKTIVKIVRLEGDSAAVGRTFRTVKGTNAFSALMGAKEDEPETFDYEDGFTFEATRDQTVRKGDLVRSTRGDEYSDDL
ncbi:hypothetical protein [Nocardia salmonicida]|uniref:hypothetical protein n=1 Tax=Nocardia salmonicida TaxID=53431 RepID=UPI0007A3F826|nr:hypothetical protein [Nocardia salmonicida]